MEIQSWNSRRSADINLHQHAYSKINITERTAFGRAAVRCVKSRGVVERYPQSLFSPPPSNLSSKIYIYFWRVQIQVQYATVLSAIVPRIYLEVTHLHPYYNTISNIYINIYSSICTR